MGLLGHIPENAYDMFLGDVADLLGQWDEACCAIEKGSESREALAWLMRIAQQLRRSSRAVGLHDFTHLFASLEEILRAQIRTDASPNQTAVDTFALVHTTLGRWLAGVRTNADYVEDLHPLHEALRLCQTEFAWPSPSITVNVAAENAQQVEKNEPVQNEKIYASSHNPGFSVTPARVEKIIDLVSRIVARQTSLIACTKGADHIHEPSGDLKVLHALADELQSTAASLRLRPLSGLLSRLDDYIWNTAEQRHVALRFQSSADDFELDGTIIDALWAPMIALLDCVFDISFDAPEERTTFGKLPSLELRVSATLHGDAMKISVTDDGRGICDKEKSIPGVELSKRLRGVRRMLRSIFGSLRVNFRKNELSLFEITVPVSLRLQDVVIIESSEQHFALPAFFVNEIVESGNFTALTGDSNALAIDYKSRIYPFVTLPRLLEDAPPPSLPRVETSLLIESHSILLINDEDVPVALGVDGIVGRQRRFVTPLPSHLQSVFGICGLILGPREEPTIVLDVVELASSARALRLQRGVA